MTPVSGSVVKGPPIVDNIVLGGLLLVGIVVFPVFFDFFFSLKMYKSHALLTFFFHLESHFVLHCSLFSL